MASMWRWKLPDTVAFSIDTSNAGASGRLRLVTTGVSTSAAKEREYTPACPRAQPVKLCKTLRATPCGTLVVGPTYRMVIDGKCQDRIAISASFPALWFQQPM